MQYPKKIMSKKEMVGLGFPMSLLDQIALERDQQIAFRPNPKNKTSPWLFDTEEFEKRRVQLAKISTQAAKKRKGVLDYDT